MLRCVASFCKNLPGKKQIVFLGAGFDSYFLMLEKQLPGLHLWVDVDLPEVIEIKQHPYSKKFSAQQQAVYKLAKGNLLNIQSIHKCLIDSGIDFNIPTLFILECVTAYIDSGKVRELLAYIANPREALSKHALSSSVTSESATSSATPSTTSVPTEVHSPSDEEPSADSSLKPEDIAALPSRFPAMVIGYDPMSKETDNFGRVMVQNLRQRGITMPSLMAFPTCEARTESLRTAGFSFAKTIDMKKAYNLIPQVEKQRIQTLEPLDEFEEFFLLLSHYCIWIGSNMIPENVGIEDESLPTLAPPAIPKISH
eukprot:MONOS_6496.2-p1 / transcript=MONOS_6496.2 / gene=MONOS_6496 / organism=Monocercomonoides_exilis_PA203 / gene_product=Leucine carboxyl methyltransferase isoform 2 , unspecified product / transcript_product=unspecified product / location=Mono_scaffold00205:64337-65646(+) / protein_length=311 / sequence_SO=supercontig / SO=protein_coding / is_pseudo=false